MSLPGIRVIFRRTNTAPNPQDLSAFACVLGACSKPGLTVNRIMTLGSLADCKNAGNGEGVEQAAEIGLTAGWPVYLCPVLSTQQAPSAVTKTPASAGVPLYLFGSALAAGGTPPAGAVLYVAKVKGLSVVQVSGGSNGVVVTGTAGSQVITVTFASMATNATIAALVTADATAGPLVAATAVGGSGAVAALTSTSLDNGALTATPLAAGVTLAIIYSGSSTALSIPSITGSAVVINGATDANGLPASTPAAIVAYLAGNGGAGAIAARLLLQLVAGGTGAGLAAAKSAAALQFGSTGAMTISGTGADMASILVKIMTAGTVGGTPNPSMQWSADGGNTFTGRTLIPPNGIVALKDGDLDTGLTATFTVAQEVDDLYTCAVAKPVVASADLLTAIDAVIADTSRKFGYITSPTWVSRAVATQIDTKLQATKTTRYLRGLFSTRNIGDGVSNETHDQWVDALNAEWTGFVSLDGLLWIVADYFSHVSGYSERIYGALGNLQRPAVITVAARRSLQAMHQSLAETAMGPLPRINYAVDPVFGHVTDPGLTHDEEKNPGLDDERFITLRTFAVRGDGEVYITRSPTMADPSDVGHSLVMYVNCLMEGARAASIAAFPFIEAPAEGIPVAESAQVPAGAISAADAARMESVVGGAVDALWFKPKTDGRPSMSPLPPGEKTITVLRNNNYIKDGFLDLELRGRPPGYNHTILIGVTLELS